MRNLAICGVLCMACVSSASGAVTCLVCRMVGVGRGVWKILLSEGLHLACIYRNDNAEFLILLISMATKNNLINVGLLL